MSPVLCVQHNPLNVSCSCLEEQSVMYDGVWYAVRLNFRKSEVRFVGGVIKGAQNTLPASIYTELKLPSPKITAAFPFLNISTINVIALAGSNLLTSLRWKTREWPRRGQARSLSAPGQAGETVGCVFMNYLFKMSQIKLFSVCCQSYVILHVRNLNPW